MHSTKKMKEEAERHRRDVAMACKESTSSIVFDAVFSGKKPVLISKESADKIIRGADALVEDSKQVSSDVKKLLKKQKERLNKLAERHDALIERHDALIERHDAMIERHDAMMGRLNQLLGVTEHTSKLSVSIDEKASEKSQQHCITNMSDRGSDSDSGQESESEGEIDSEKERREKTLEMIAKCGCGTPSTLLVKFLSYPLSDDTSLIKH